MPETITQTEYGSWILNPESLDAQLKIELVARHIDKMSYEELHEALTGKKPKYCPAKV